MNNNTSRNSGCSINLFPLLILTVAFVVLKLTGVISWSWFWVLSPTIFSAVLTVAVIGIALGVEGKTATFYTKRSKKEMEDKYRLRRNMYRSNSQVRTSQMTYDNDNERNNAINAVQEAAKQFEELSREEQIRLFNEELARVKGSEIEDALPYYEYQFENEEDEEFGEGFQPTMKRN